jgi:CheY-like chemotaxis protein
VEQILWNLIVNARDAMPSGGKLTVETQNVELDARYAAQHADVTAGAYVLLAVTDTGMGMDPATRDRIFEPFFTTKAQGQGTGLGLSTVFGIVKQSEGHIYVYSEPGRGTSFKLYFPRVEADGGACEVTADSEVIRANGETILLVEDEEMVRTVARDTLERAGYAVLEAADGAEAVRMLEEQCEPVHLVLTDVVMPGMSGRELVDSLKTRWPELRVLLMSGYTDDAVVRHGILSADTAFIQKPFTAASLARKVGEVLRSG